MNDITAPRKVVIDHCRKQERSRNKMTLVGFALQLNSICSAVDDNGGILTPDQAWFIAEGTWTLIAKVVGLDMATAFSCTPMHDEFDDLSDIDRVSLLMLSIAYLLLAEEYEGEVLVLLCARTLSVGIRIATDALLASSPEIFQEG